ncbi:HAD family hydrolase [Clostridium sp. JN-9]|uniref:HAD family hydrolase n=1 Tax=Clostridium sp. JN-9 TaxID=2507159 RepID=UPI000FFE199C|nr:HAD family hydrolase [Clostridium sp. JN-9]QAT39715.1 HAD family hydrolase [Clostridium sp. JN-9]
MKKAVFFDIDGTLLDCLNGITDITPAVKKAIRELQNEGNYVFIASGRPYAFISSEILNFGFDGYIFTNGAQVRLGDKLIYKKPFNKNFTKELVLNCDKLNIQYILQGEKYSYLNNDFERLYSYYDNYGISRRYLTGDYDIDKVDVFKMEMLYGSKQALDYCFSKVNEDYNYGLDSSNSVFELYSRRDSKASGIKKVLKYLNIPLENSYAFGDDTNDIEMLEAVGCGIAMGNASDMVKSHADKVTDEVQRDGVALGIERFIL